MENCGERDLDGENIEKCLLAFTAFDTSGHEDDLCFAENLMICAKSDDCSNANTSGANVVGGYCINVERIGEDSRKFLVGVAATMNVDNCCAGGTKLVGTIAETLQCLEEKRTEFIHRDDGDYEKRLFIGSEEDCYYIKIDHTCPCDASAITRSYEIPINKHPKLMSEASNIVLMRYLALNNYHGSLSFESITIDGEIEASHYRCTSASWMNIDDRNLEVYRIDRRRMRDEKITGESKTLLTKSGRILRHEWLDTSYLLRINPYADPNVVKKNCCRDRSALRENWPEDLELMSKYLDAKSCNVVKHTEYLKNHPEVKKLLADYTTTLLMVKPEDVIGFTVQHFRAFAPNPDEGA